LTKATSNENSRVVKKSHKSSNSNKSSNKGKYKPKIATQVGYAKVRNETKDSKSSFSNTTVLSTTPKMSTDFLLKNNDTHILSTPTSKTVAHKTASASKMPGVPTTTSERGTPIVRNSRKPEEMSSSTESLIIKIFNTTKDDNPISVIESSIYQNHANKSNSKINPTKLSVSSSSSSAPTIKHVVQEPKPSPEQILQFTPNDIRPSFNPNSIQSQIPNQNFNHNHQPIIYSTSIPILNSNIIRRNSFPIPQNLPYHNYPQFHHKRRPQLHPSQQNNVRLGRMAESHSTSTNNQNPIRSLSSFYPPRQPQHDPNHVHRRNLMPTPPPTPPARLRPRRMTLPHSHQRNNQPHPSQASKSISIPSSQFSSRSLDLGTSRLKNKKIVKKSSASPLGDGWLPFSFKRSDADIAGEEDDSEEELLGVGSSGFMMTDKDGLPIVDPQHPVVQNALHPLGNPAREPDQLIK
jgi:hypothetical protein